MAEATKLSKTRIDKAGRALARNDFADDVSFLEADDVVDTYRASHLAPLTRTTAVIQSWLDGRGEPYYLAQRLKRKPQILRKLARLSVRLSQLQDIGGLRIIVPRDGDVDAILSFLEEQLQSLEGVALDRITDYRERGRDGTGYRALHVLLDCDGYSLELQIRSDVQHAWAENIERTSVIYGYVLKEEDGDPEVLNYFKLLSDALYEFEAGREIDPALDLQIERKRVVAERVIAESPRASVLNGEVSSGVVQAISSKLRGSAGISNWILVFDWNSGSFVTWDQAPRDPGEAMDLYVSYERRFSSEDGFEVVLVGASEPATLERTHSHYFGLARYDKVLESLGVVVSGLSNRLGLGLDEREVLHVLYRKNKWGSSRVARDTIHNVYCPNVSDLDDVLRGLVAKGLLNSNGGYSLNQKAKAEIQSLL